MRKYMRHFNLVIVILTLSFPVLGQTNIQLIFNTDKLIDKVDIFDLSQREFYSSAYKDTLSFHFKKDNVDCYNIRYHEKDKMYRQQIWLDSGNIVLKSHIAGNDLIIDTVINSPIYYKAQNFYKDYSRLLKTNDSTKINGFLFKNVEDNLTNPFSYAIGQNFLFRNQNSKINLVKFKTLLDQQGDSFNWFLLYDLVVRRVDAILASNKTNVLGFVFLDRKNQKSKLNLTHGTDFYILDFWFLGCAPCIRDHKEIKKYLGKLTAKKIGMIGISIDDISKSNSWQTYLAQNKNTWKNYIQDNNSKLTNHLGINSYPTYLILNANGEIIESYNSFSDISKRFKLDE